MAWEFDVATSRLSVSPNAAQMVGVPLGALPQSKEQAFRQFHPEDVAKYVDAVRQAASEGRSHQCLFRFIRPDNGKVVWLEDCGRAVTSESNAPIRYYGVVKDVTERVEADDSLRASEQRFRLLADAAPVLIWLSDTNKLCTWFNRPWLDFVGRPMEQELGNGWAENVHPEDFDRCLKHYTESFDARIRFSMEYRLRNGQLGYRWVLDNGIPYFGPFGEFAGYIGSCTDIHELKESQVALRHETRKSSRLVDSNIIGIVFSQGTLLTDANEAFLQMTGYTRSEIRECLHWQMITPGDYCNADTRAIRTLAEKGVCPPYQKEIVCKDGSRLAVLTGAAIVEDSESSAVWFVQDLSRIKEVENKLREADRRKDEFLATLAHELRNPLAPLRHGLEVLKLARNSQETVEESREMMEKQLKQMIRLTDDLLDVSRISRGVVALKLEQLDLSIAIQNAIDSTRQLMGEAQHQLTVHLPDDPIYVHGDLTRLSQVFTNLLNNSAKFTPEGGDIRLEMIRRNDQAIVTIRDNGIGISSEKIPKILENFSTEDTSRGRMHGGLGIGLALVKSFVEMHRGQIRVESGGRGRGCVVTVCLLVCEPASEPHGSDEVASTESVKARRVLIVDDDRDVAKSLSTLLKVMGHLVSVAHSGIEALEAGAEFRPDIMMVDIGMPIMNGYETARLIRQQPWGRSGTLIAMTGWGQEQDRLLSAESGFDEHHVKPIEPESLARLMVRVSAH